MNKNNASSGGLGLTGVLTVVFVVLKLIGVIDWSWWWVLSPLWIDLILCVIFIVGLAIYYAHENKKYGISTKGKKDKWKF
jgi:hypothetical protein